MNFNEHYELEGLHAFLSPSQYHWVNYDLEKLEDRFYNHRAKELGTELHEYAATAIKLGRKQPKTKDTVSMFVNDALGYSMRPEQALYYSPNCFGHADALGFTKGKILRIHDLKTGKTPASMMQLKVYAAIFCLEYGFDPHDLEIHLRIYQLNEKIEEDPDPDEIQDIMVIIVTFDNHLNKLKEAM